MCPLCNEKVINENWTEHESDFYCPTGVTLGKPPHVESHYHRITWEGCPEYTILVPPFYLTWMNVRGSKTLRIYDGIGPGPWKYFLDIELEEAIVWAKRLSNLKAFA